MVGDVGDGASHVEPVGLQPGCLFRHTSRVDVNQRHAGAVRREHLAVRESKPARAARDDHTEPCDVELR